MNRTWVISHIPPHVYPGYLLLATAPALMYHSPDLLHLLYSVPWFLQLYVVFSLIPHCNISSSSHASIFLAAQQATYVLAGPELCVCCPACQRAHAVHAVEQCLLQWRRAELPFPLFLCGTPAVLSMQSLSFCVPCRS